MVTPRPIRLLRPTEIDRAVDVLAAAFTEDPAVRWLLPDPATRQVGGRVLLRIWVRYAILEGTAWCTEGLEGVALRRAPGRADLRLFTLLRAGILLVPLMLGLGATWRLLRTGWEMDRRHRRAVTGPHWTCWMIGVDPRYRGMGLGGALMRHTFAQADAADLPCYLETTHPKALQVHLHHGFEVVANAPLPGTDLRVWNMVRPPSGASRAVAA
jgi:GNAT superfamily N-acetyltransferase